MTRLGTAMAHEEDVPTGLLYHAGGLGDFVLSLPAVLRVAGAYPQVRWRYWGPRDRLALLPDFGPPPPELLRFGHTLWGTSPAPEAVSALSQLGVALAFGGKSAPPWAGRSGPGTIGLAGFPNRGGSWVPVHQAGQLDRAGVPRIRTPGRLQAWREHVLPRRDPREIILHPGSGDPKKNLSVSTWAEVIARLRPTGLPVRIALGPAEQERRDGHPIFEAAQAVQLCETLQDLLAALKSAALFLGNDSGPTHLAAALGVPTVAVFGPSDPKLWRPLGSAVRVLATRHPCAPCTFGGPIACTIPNCLADSGPPEIAEAALELLAVHLSIASI